MKTKIYYGGLEGRGLNSTWIAFQGGQFDGIEQL